MVSAVSDRVFRCNVQVQSIDINGSLVEYACAGVIGGPDDESAPLHLLDVQVAAAEVAQVRVAERPDAVRQDQLAPLGTVADGLPNYGNPVSPVQQAFPTRERGPGEFPRPVTDVTVASRSQPDGSEAREAWRTGEIMR